MKQKLLLLAMLAVFHLSASKAQDQLVLVGTKTNDYGIKYELYKSSDPFDQTQFRKYIFENGDFVWGNEEENKKYNIAWLNIDFEKCYHLTFTDGVVERKEDGKIHINLTDGTYIIMNSFSSKLVLYFVNGRSDDEYICDKSGLQVEYRVVPRIGRVDYVKLKVGDNKYEEYKKYKEYSDELIRIDTTSNFLYKLSSNPKRLILPTAQILESPIYERKEFSEELKEKSIQERSSKYALNLMDEISYYDNVVLPNNGQKEYIAYLVANGRGAVVGLDGMTTKMYKKLNKKNLIDHDAIIKRYKHELDSIQESWIVRSLHQDRVTFDIAPHDTIISYTTEEIETHRSSDEVKNTIFYKIKYKNGSEVVVFDAYDKKEIERWKKYLYDFPKEDYVNDKGVNIHSTYVMPNGHPASFGILNGTLKKENCVVKIDEKKGVILTFDNGNTFFPKERGFYDLKCDGSPRPNGWKVLTCSEVTPVNGRIIKPDGEAEEMKDGLTESMRLVLAQERAARAAKEAEEERQALIAQYGKTYAEAALRGDFVKGLPADLVNMVCNSIGVKFANATMWDDGTTRYDLYMPIKVLIGESPYVGRIYMKDNKLESWTLYQ